MKKYMVMAVFAMIAIMALGMLNTGAWFTDSKTGNIGELHSGTLELDGEGFTSFDLGEIASDLAPGDTTKEVSIIIKNAGSIPLAWFGDMEITGGPKLLEALYIDYAEMEFWYPDGASQWETTDNFILDGVGAGPGKATFDSYADLGLFDVISLDVWDNNNHMGELQNYEHMGALDPGYSYKLTFKFGLAEGAGDEYQGDVTNPVQIKFNVSATQINETAMNLLGTNFGTNHYGWMQAQVEKQP